MMADDTQEIITVCIVIIVVTTIAADFMNQKANGKPTASEVTRPLVGGAVAGALLFLMALANERVAKDFAILAALGSILRNGNGLFSLLDKVTGTTTTPATVTKTTATQVANQPGGSTYNSQVPQGG